MRTSNSMHSSIYTDSISASLLQAAILIIISLSNIDTGFSSYISAEDMKTVNVEQSATKFRTLPRNTTLKIFNSTISTDNSKLQFKSLLHIEKNLSSVSNPDFINIKYKRKDLYHSNVDLGNLPRPKGNDYMDNHITDSVPMSSEGYIPIKPTNDSMYFGTENSTVITTQVGATALIPCTVHQIGEGVVSWIRKKDYHLLTVGLTTYSSDERFSTNHIKHQEDWTLQIKYVQQRDAGIYECQISTHPPTSIFLHLIVVEARAEISGPPIRYLTPGSTLKLNCVIVQNTENSEYIFWYHDNRMINYDFDRGINVSTDSDFQSSELVISNTRREHSGNYTCVASNTQAASVLVHIFKGDNPAAMYHGHVGSSTKSYQIQLLRIVSVLCYISYVKPNYC